VIATRALPLMLVLFAGLVLWFAFAILTPYAISHQPGPENPSFGWYLLYHGLPLYIVVILGLLLAAAWRLWRR
jgi:membrane protein DedA with SNARE-associated domain